MRAVFALFALMSLQAFGQVTGKPTNLDEHGDMPGMRMSNVDGPTGKYRRPITTAPRLALPHVLSGPLVPITQRQTMNLNETVLTPDNVGKLQLRYTHYLDNDQRLEAQPLIFPKVPMADGNTYDVVIYATMANLVEAFDLNSDHLLWSQRVGGNPISDNPQIDGYSINQHWGILSSCAGDASTFQLYCVSWSDPSDNWKTAHHKFHAIDIRNGSSKTIDLDGLSYSPGNGLPSLYFRSAERKQRASLVLANENGRKVVFVPFGTIQETSAASHGWMIAVDVESFKVTAVWANCPRYSGGGIWMAGGTPQVGPDGDIYFLTGNGSFDGVTEFGESFIRMHYTGSALQVKQWWSAYSDSGRAGGPATGTHITVDHGGGWDDMDQGSAPPVLFSVAGKLMLGGAGKDDVWDVLDPDNMGNTVPADFANPAANFAKLLAPPALLGFPSPMDLKTCANQPPPINPTAPVFTDLNKIYCGKTHHQHSSPIVFSGPNGVTYLYAASENGNLRAFTVSRTGRLNYIGCSAESASANVTNFPGGMPGAFLSLSANGANNGLIFAAFPLGDANKDIVKGYVAAYSATSFGKYGDGSGSLPLLWKSPTYTFSKFNQIVVDGGMVLVPTYGRDGLNGEFGAVDVYAVRN